VCRCNVAVFSYVKAAGLESQDPDTPRAKLKNRWSYPYHPPYSFVASFSMLLDDAIALTYGTVDNSFFFSAESKKN
jgi:hypothetical protein